jgi:acylphosphatase
MAETERQLHAVVHGRVQGVNFRYYTLQTANQLGLTGWVRNRPDRTVEVVAEGRPGPLERLLAFLHSGPPSATVTRVEVQWRAATGAFDRFEIR